MSELDRETYYGKISKSARVFNKLDPEQVKEAIKLASIQFNRYSRDITNVHLQEGNLDIPYIKLDNKEPIEYVIEEYKTSQKMEQRTSSGEER